MERKVVSNEWIFTLLVPARGPADRVTVRATNADPQDKEFAEILSKLIEVWCNRKRK